MRIKMSYNLWHIHVTGAVWNFVTQQNPNKIKQYKEILSFILKINQTRQKLDTDHCSTNPMAKQISTDIYAITYTHIIQMQITFLLLHKGSCRYSLKCGFYPLDMCDWTSQ